MKADSSTCTWASTSSRDYGEKSKPSLQTQNPSNMADSCEMSLASSDPGVCHSGLFCT